MDKNREICATLAESLQTRLEMELSLGTGFARVPPFAIAAAPQISASTATQPAERSTPAAEAGIQRAAQPESPARPAAPSAGSIDFTQKAPAPATAQPAAPAGASNSHDHIEVHVMPRHTGSGKKLTVIEPLVEEAIVCKKCALCKKRRQVVFGEGSLDAELMIIGQAPGREEDLQGRPFAGNEGRFLEDVIGKGMQRTREDLYFTTFVKCRPAGNRDPHEDEAQACLPYLQKQVEIVQPKAIIAIGTVAAQLLSGDKVSIEQMRGNWYEFNNVPVMPVYHTAFMVRMQRLRKSTNDKKAAAYMRIFWEDLKLVCHRLGWEHA